MGFNTSSQMKKDKSKSRQNSTDERPPFYTAIGMQEANRLRQEMKIVKGLSKGILHGRTITPDKRSLPNNWMETDEIS